MHQDIGTLTNIQKYIRKVCIYDLSYSIQFGIIDREDVVTKIFKAHRS